jgi:predicted transcriptional regulator
VTICADHDFLVVTASASDEPVGLSCRICGRSWPVGRALPQLYDQDADRWGGLDEDEEAERTTAEYDKGREPEVG